MRPLSKKKRLSLINFLEQIIAGIEASDPEADRKARQYILQTAGDSPELLLLHLRAELKVLEEMQPRVDDPSQD